MRPLAGTLPEYVGLHAFLVEEIFFAEVEDVKFNLLLGSRVGYFEVKPGRMPFCIAVYSH